MWKFIVLPSHYIDKSMNGLLPPLMNGGLPPSMNSSLPPLMNGRRPPSLDEQLASSLLRWTAPSFPWPMGSPPLMNSFPPLNSLLLPSTHGLLLLLIDSLLPPSPHPSLDEWSSHSIQGEHIGNLRKKMNHFEISWHRHVYKRYDNVDTNLQLNLPPIWCQGKAGMKITDVWHMSDWPLTSYDFSWLHFLLRVTMHVVITVLIITGEQPPFFFFSYQMRGATLHCQCGNHTTQDKWWATTIIVAVIIIVSPSIPPLPFPTQLISHHHQTKDSGHSHVTPPQQQSATTTTDHDHNNDTTRWPCNNHSMTTSHTDHLLHHYCFSLIFSLSY